MANEHSLRQVCHARTSYGESRAFLWQPLRFFSPHGCSPFTGAKLDFLTITRARWARLCGAEGAGQTQRLFPPSLRAPRTLLDCQAADSTAAILWGGKKTVATQQNAGWVVVVFFFSVERGQLRENRNRVYASFCRYAPAAPRSAGVGLPQNHPRIVGLRSASGLFHVTISSNMARQRRLRSNIDHARTAPLWLTAVPGKRQHRLSNLGKIEGGFQSLFGFGNNPILRLWRRRIKTPLWKSEATAPLNSWCQSPC